VAALLRAYANIASELAQAGYPPNEIEKIKAEVDHYAKARDEIRLASGDYLDLKMYEPAMRHLIDTYIRAEDSEKISAFDDLSLIQLVVERGPEVVDALPEGIRKDREAVAETIENNVRRLIINESPVDPAYYEKMSRLLDALIEQRRKGVIDYKEYLEKIAALTREATQPGGGPGAYPPSVRTAAQRALYNNLVMDADLALTVDAAVQASRQDGWRDNAIKLKRVRNAIRAVLKEAAEAAAVQGFAGTREKDPGYSAETETTRILDLVKNQGEY
jgi:type I restriction enzyme R subunit